MDAQSHSTNATASAPNDNMTDYLMQTLQHQMNAVNASAPFPAANLSTAENGSSLLMDLLNSPGSAHPINPLDLDFDEQMHDVIAALGEDSESLSNDEDSGKYSVPTILKDNYFILSKFNSTAKQKFTGYVNVRGHANKQTNPSMFL